MAEETKFITDSKGSEASLYLSHRSLFFENMFRHHFAYEVARTLLSRPTRQYLTILNSEVDDEGIDIIMRSEGVTRYIQLKTLSKRNTPNPYAIKETLGDLPGGAIVWICYNPKEEFRPFAYHVMGGQGNEPFPGLVDFPPTVKKRRQKKDEPRVREGYRNVCLSDVPAKQRSLEMVALVDFLFPWEKDSAHK